MDDGSIVDLYLDRNEEAISKTTEKYGKQLWRVAHNIVKDAQGAEECVNDTYLAAWNSIPPHEPREYLFAFLARIARHIALDFCKQRNRLKRQTFLCELNTELEQCLPSSDDVGKWADSMVLCELINRFLATLGDEGRNVFVRRYWFMDSVTDISHRYGLSQSKVKSILFRSRNQLRQFLEKEGYKI